EAAASAPACVDHHLQHGALYAHNWPSAPPASLAVVSSRVLLEDCSFRDLPGLAIDVSGGRLDLRRSLVEDVAQGIHASRSTVLLTDSTVSGSEGTAAAVRIDLDGPTGERSRIERCVLEGGPDNGLHLSGTSADLIGNLARC